MIYYHFPNKRALYTTIVRDRYTTITDKLQTIAAEPLPPDRKLDRLIETLVQSIDEANHFLPIFCGKSPTARCIWVPKSSP